MIVGWKLLKVLYCFVFMFVLYSGFSQSNKSSRGISVAYSSIKSDIIEVGYAVKTLGYKLPIRTRERQQIIMKNGHSFATINASYNIQNSLLGLEINPYIGNILMFGYGLHFSKRLESDEGFYFSIDGGVGLNLKGFYLLYSYHFLNNTNWKHLMKNNEVKMVIYLNFLSHDNR